MAHTDHDQDMALYAARRERLNRILDHYECGAGDWAIQQIGTPPSRAAMIAVGIERLRTVGAPENLPRIGRWAVVTKSTKGHGHFVDCILNITDAERVAIANIDEGRWPVCYFDLDRLSGTAPSPEEGDLVVLRGSRRRTFHVVAVEGDDDQASFALALEPDGRPVHHRRADQLEVVRRSDPRSDQRLPLRYDVIRVRADVEFTSRAR
jgi:hypothetical protein